MTRTISGWPKCVEEGMYSCQCSRSSSTTPAPGPAWQSPACFPTLPNAPLPSVACVQVSWQTEQLCSERSWSRYVHLVYHGRLPDCACAGLPRDCSKGVQLQLYSFHFLYSAWCRSYFTSCLVTNEGTDYVTVWIMLFFQKKEAVYFFFSKL